MSKKLLRGMAVGIFLSTSVIAYQHYFNEGLEDKHIEQEEAIVFEDELQKYLEDNDFVVISKEEYIHWQALVEGFSTDRSPDEENTPNQTEAGEQPKQEEAASQQPTNDTKEIYLTIEPGMNSNEVGRQLIKLNVIKNQMEFETYLINHGLETKVKAGTYKLRPNMTIEQVVEKIT